MIRMAEMRQSSSIMRKSVILYRVALFHYLFQNLLIHLVLIETSYGSSYTPFKFFSQGVVVPEALFIHLQKHLKVNLVH